jgi:O-methyltransferase involved in polyketide biosynthesis
MADTQIERIMRGLKCSREEAEQILADDKAIDRGERMAFDLDKEKEKEAKKYARTGTRQTNGVKVERKRKENPTKAQIIAEIAKFLTENGYDSVEITNKERQIALKVGENAFELTLVQKRQPKK